MWSRRNLGDVKPWRLPSAQTLVTSPVNAGVGCTSHRVPGDNKYVKAVKAFHYILAFASAHNIALVLLPSTQ